MCDPPPIADDGANWKRMEEVLGLILNKAKEFYAGREDEICLSAVRIAALAVIADGIDKHTAKEMAETMAVLADAMLQVEGAGEWRFDTLIRLKKIRNTEPELANFKRRDGGASPTPTVQQPQA